jgi:Ca2+-binding EF-hand superfamily protein
MAFSKLDKDGSGIVDGEEIASVYNASKHPDVIAKRKTEKQVLMEFLDTFDVGGIHDGKVTFEEFLNYYANIGASIDNEDYFELMIRNAWHISGGEGMAANTSNRIIIIIIIIIIISISLSSSLSLLKVVYW